MSRSGALSFSGQLLYIRQIAPFPARFVDVAADWGESCAARTGIVVRVDVQGPDARDVYHTHLDFYAIYVVRRGRGIHVLDGVPSGVSRGDVFAMAAGATHAYSQHEDLVLDALYFLPEALAENLETLSATPGFPPVLTGAGPGSRKWLHLDPAAYSAVRVQFEELRREWASGAPEGRLLTEALFLRLLVSLCRGSQQALSTPGGKRDSAELAVSDAVRLLDEGYAGALRIADVARQVGLCPDRLTEVFTGVMGRSPRDYLRYVRIEHAKLLLGRTGLPLADVAIRTGFADAPHLVRTFRTQVGKTPGAYRAESL
ncbi:helix-turn-helix domain-containing protein [bacterium]|nr:MAG: helix-turn-helix domain-containing protein [bacterium]